MGMKTLQCFMLILLLLSAAGCGRKDEGTVNASEPPPVQVRVLKVQPAPFTATVAVTGAFVSRARVDVKAETIGRVARFDKQEGDSVQAGEALVWVDDEDYRLAVRQAETVVQVAEAAVERARVVEAHSRSELDRATKLLASGGITDKDLKAADIARKDAQAQTALTLAQLDQARAALEIARKRLRNTVIRAPVSGEIQKKFINPGAYVEAPTAVLTIVDNLRLELEALVPAVNLAAIRPGQRVVFSINSYPGQEFEGRVIEISPAVESETRSAKVRIQVDNRGRSLKDGMFAEGRILTGVTSQALLVPGAAVYRDDRSAKLFYVFVVENGKAARRTVRVGNETDSSLEIAEGLKAGDLLIAEQSIELADGVPIRAAPEETRR